VRICIREIEWDLKGPLSPTALQNLTKKHNIKKGLWEGKVEGQLFLWHGQTVCLQKTGEAHDFNSRLVDVFSGETVWSTQQAPDAGWSQLDRDARGFRMLPWETETRHNQAQESRRRGCQEQEEEDGRESRAYVVGGQNSGVEDQPEYRRQWRRRTSCRSTSSRSFARSPPPRHTPLKQHSFFPAFTGHLS